MKTALCVIAIAIGMAAPASAQSQNWVGEVRSFAGDYCPSGWLETDGRAMNIAQSQALFSILGTRFGGDGRSTFNLPRLAALVSEATGAGPQVELYSDCDFVGGKAVLPVGNYSSAQMPGAVPSRTLSSMKIPSGMRVQVYDGANLDGQSVQFSDNRSCLVGDGFNDRTVSLRVMTTGATPPSASGPRVALKSCIATTGNFPAR